MFLVLVDVLGRRPPTAGMTVLASWRFATPFGRRLFVRRLHAGRSRFRCTRRLPFGQHLGLFQQREHDGFASHGENLFRALAEPQPLPEAQRSVAPEYLEGSSVNPTTEMVDMIAAARLFEANVKMMETQDEMLGDLIGRLMQTA